jgi:hypothetical protein
MWAPQSRNFLPLLTVKFDFAKHKFIALHPDFEQNFVASLGNIFLKFFFNSLWIRTLSEMIRSSESALWGAFVSVTVAIEVEACVFACGIPEIGAVKHRVAMSTFLAAPAAKTN